MAGEGAAEPAEWLAAFSPWGGPAQHSPGLPAPSLDAPARAAGPDVALLLERWVRRVALGGDQRRGVARLDIGEGPLSGAQVLVVTEAGGVSVELTLPPSMGEADWADRLRSRLARRGYVAEVTVR